MTTDPNFYLTCALSALVTVSIVTWAGLAGWRGWLELKRQELAERSRGSAGEAAALPTTASRIEIADLKERVRKLEAIAAGVDL